jgi:hypothetical protein
VSAVDEHFYIYGRGFDKGFYVGKRHFSGTNHTGKAHFRRGGGVICSLSSELGAGVKLSLRDEAVQKPGRSHVGNDECVSTVAKQTVCVTDKVLKLLVVQANIHGDTAFHAVSATQRETVPQLILAEILSPHTGVESSAAHINGVCAGSYCRLKRGGTSGGSEKLRQGGGGDFHYGIRLSCYGLRSFSSFAPPDANFPFGKRRKASEVKIEPILTCYLRSRLSI